MFKIGDTVKIISTKDRLNDIGIEEIYVNAIGTVEEANSQSSIGVRLSIDVRRWLGEGDLQLVTTDAVEILKDRYETKDTPKMCVFESGATRNIDTNKLDYDGFLSPLAIKRFAQYMHKHRFQADGTLRDSDNWQKGIPKERYRKSLWRHFVDLWSMLRGWITKTDEGEDVEELLCAILFNTQGLLHEILKEKLED